MVNDEALLGLSPSQFADVVETALELYRGGLDGSPERLYESALAGSSLIAMLCLTDAPTNAEKNEAMKSLLRWALERLRPAGKPDETHREWQQVLALEYYFFRGYETWGKVGETLGLSLGLEYNRRKTALEKVARLIRHALEHRRELDDLWREQVNSRLEDCRREERAILELMAVLDEEVTLFELGELIETYGLGDPNYVSALKNWRLLVEGEHDQSLRINPDIRHHVLIGISAAGRKRGHEIAAALFMGRYDFLNAARHWREIGLNRPAAILLIEHHDTLVKRGQVEALLRLIGQFRREELGDKLWAELKITAGKLALLAEDVPKAIRDLMAAASAESVLLRALAYYRLAKVSQKRDLDTTLGYYDHGLDLLTGMAADADEPLDSGEVLTAGTLRFDLLLGKAWIHIQERIDLVQAARLLSRAEQELPPGDHRRTCDLHNAWGGLYSRQKSYQVEVEHRFKALVAAQATGDSSRIIMTAHNLGQAYGFLGRQEEGRGYLSLALEEAEAIGDKPNIGKNLQAIGASYCLEADARAQATGETAGSDPKIRELYETAVHHYLLARDIYESIGDENWLAHLYADLAEAYGALYWVGEMRLFYEKAVEKQKGLKNDGLSDFLNGLIERFRAELTKELDDGDIKLLEHAHQQGRITNEDTRYLLDISKDKAQKKLKALVGKELLVRRGGGPESYYVPAR